MGLSMTFDRFHRLCRPVVFVVIVLPKTRIFRSIRLPIPINRSSQTILHWICKLLELVFRRQVGPDDRRDQILHECPYHLPKTLVHIREVVRVTICSGWNSIWSRIFRRSLWQITNMMDRRWPVLMSDTAVGNWTTKCGRNCSVQRPICY
jgi:hypothetical protein